MFGTAQAAPGEQTYVPPAEPQAPAVAPEATPAPTPQQPATPAEQSQTAVDPTVAAINDLREKVEGLQPKEDNATDLLTALEQDSEPDLTPQTSQQPEAEAQPQGGGPEAQAQLDALYELIDERATQIVQPIQQREVAREMQAVQQRNPDIMQMVDQIADRIGDLEAQTGAEGLVNNPAMVEQTYKVLRAEAAEASATPAEQAAQAGAVLETNAGQSQTGGSSEVEEYMKQVYGKQGTPSIFGG